MMLELFNKKYVAVISMCLLTSFLTYAQDGVDNVQQDYDIGKQALTANSHYLAAEQMVKPFLLEEEDAPFIVVKTNVLYDALTSMNLAVEIRLSKKYSLELPVVVNPWTFSDNKKFKFTLVQPEIRYWLNQSYKGHFLGVHLMYANYNVGGIDFPFNMWKKLNDYRYEGNLYGLGISYGYEWKLGDHWLMEATGGLGYFHARSDKYVYNRCGKFLGKSNKNYFGLTKLGFSISYIIK